jgi:hypothetical protein
MKEYIGVDLGKRKAVVVKKDRRGKVTGRATLAVTQAALESYFSKQDSKSSVVVEATGNWMYLYETIERYVPEGYTGSSTQDQSHCRGADQDRHY